MDIVYYTVTLHIPTYCWTTMITGEGDLVVYSIIHHCFVDPKPFAKDPAFRKVSDPDPDPAQLVKDFFLKKIVYKF